MALLAAHAAEAQSPPTLSKAFGAASIAVGQSTSLTFNIANPNASTTLTSITVGDNFPAGLIVATPNGASNTCGGTINVAASAVSITHGSLAPGASCTWSINVTATSAGTKNNTTGVIFATESGNGGTASASLNVPVPSPPTVAKAFGAGSIAVGQSTSLTFTMANPNATFTTLTDITVGDNFPGGLIVATPNGASNTCGGTINVAASAVSITHGSLAPGASCAWSINVTATSGGTKNNTTGAVFAAESGPGDTASASIDVIGTPLLVSAKSRKTHGTAGTFDLPLTLVPSGVNHNPTTEPRTGPAQTIVLTFDKPIDAATVTITEGVATAAAPTFSGNDVIVNLTGVTNQQYVTVSLTNVASTDGGMGGSGSARIGFLLADVNGNRVISVADLGLVNAQLAQTVTATNYLKDVNASGTLSVADKGITNANLTNSLPTP